MTYVSLYYLTPSASPCPSGPVTSSLLILSQRLQPVISCSKLGCCSVPHHSLLLLHQDQPLTPLSQNAAPLLSRCSWSRLRQPLLLLTDSECGGCDAAAVCTSNSLPPKTTAAASRSVYSRRASSSLRSVAAVAASLESCRAERSGVARNL